MQIDEFIQMKYAKKKLLEMPQSLNMWVNSEQWT